MSLARHFVATVASRAYLTVLGLLVLPLYMQRMGMEAYGLVVLFSTLQVWFQLLDLGLTATLAREAARFNAGSAPAAEFRHLLRMLERALFLAVLAAGAALYLGSEAIALRWLNLQAMEPHQASRAIEWMALSVMARLLCELYRSAITGFERLSWLAASNAVFGTLRFLGVIPLLDGSSAAASNFFAFQFGVGLVELVVLRVKTRRLAPLASMTAAPRSRGSLRSLLGFSASMSVAAMVWVFASQFDKLVLSGLLSLADYGLYGLAVAAAAGVLLATGSLADALIPRITTLHAQDKREAVVQLYRQASQWTAVIACSTSILLACHAEKVLWAWTGNPAIAISMSPVLALYALGNAAMAMAALPFYLQLAQGRLKLHLLGTGLMLTLLVPTVLWATARNGATGAAAAWLAIHALYLLAWTPVAHRHIAPGLHLRWLRGDIAPVALAAAACGMATWALPWPDGRVATAFQLLAVACGVLLAAVASVPSGRLGLLQLRARLA